MNNKGIVGLAVVGIVALAIAGAVALGVVTKHVNVTSTAPTAVIEVK